LQPSGFRLFNAHLDSPPRSTDWWPSQTEFFQLLDREVQSGPAAIVFELAYQARIAIDQIKFAIRHAEQSVPLSESAREVNLQLLDALNRLQSAERHFPQIHPCIQWAVDTKNRNGNGRALRSAHGRSVFCFGVD
jgi:hypothetical protein